ncbi:threonine/homoserine/homoserine lactone efflux protein [Leucobacter luti]|uniref:Threonine/homoserine/homoserine lactone efflux protein n=1 Tax=Leucobacter luti TaxID=340320 RepID=A0A4V3CYV9_9MICO|nr:LysE family translocator [Leucobacter luti]TDP95658.1 threonine/homoserine/homoserine lactone efflux protein [Leucobacter luti]
MPTPESLFAFSLAALLLIIVPGPSVLFVIGRSLYYGRRGGLMSVLGNSLGVLPLVAAVAFGVGTIVAQSIVVFTVIKLLGAGYLIYLGVQAIRHRTFTEAEVQDPAVRARTLNPTVLLRQGFLVGVTNPKAIVFLVAVLPQFVVVSSGSVQLQMLILGVMFVAIGLASDAAWAVLAGSAQQWFARSPRRLSAARGAGGALMIGLGSGLALTGTKGEFGAEAEPVTLQL